MPLPSFVRRPENPKESICTKCFVTIRITPQFLTLEEAQKDHKCLGIDLSAAGRQCA